MKQRWNVPRQTLCRSISVPEFARNTLRNYDYYSSTLEYCTSTMHIGNYPAASPTPS